VAYTHSCWDRKPLLLQALEQCLAALANVRVSGVKIAGIPRIRNVPRVGRKIQQPAYLALRVAARDAAHVRNVHPVHADKVIIRRIVALAHLPRALFGAVDPLGAQNCRRAGMYGAAQLLRARRGGISRHESAEAEGFCPRAQDEFRHRGTADVAVAHE